MAASRYAVIGQPIAHSLSPRIHPLFAAQFSIELSYEAIEIAPAELAVRLPQLHADGYSGINVTLPHKATVAALCESVSERAQLAGAVNCLKRSDTGWVGDNTDGEGLMRDLARLGIAVASQRVLLLGAGGAARGVIAPLLALQPKELVVSSRNPWKPEELAERFKGRGPLRPCTHLALKGDHYDLIINATSAGHDGSMPRLPGPLLVSGGSCYDLSYGKAHAPFAAWAQSQGAAKIADGLGMLVEQAAVSFEIWLGKSPDVEPVLAALRNS
ncbi:shikimate dehydrogenase [Hydrocarboniphaga sp.]|uniref:shikimate dehydrogenase n=1 Tax=Hydrocarboniphaga sp. TaxID=2033016 RepID=UPI003D0D3758